ncbi:hypothetical protein CAPTEDRAFT_208832 [Capitella teleta]|uniref:Homeobox domain-containing protein n=1 Tax=Capitella teleta TaxID=283909 RepID=R7U8W4_CAPTE|nr:hypothetical protein CAPTEDRAFT_208832 [Capitella teleta]|eukprot:ELU02409.1 hypothetical protein CAPTEDRAFT_208832 [Capitella teleta]
MANILFSIDNILRGTTAPRSPHINVCDDEKTAPLVPDNVQIDTPDSGRKSNCSTSSSEGSMISEGVSDQSFDENRNPKKAEGGGKSKKARTTFTADQTIILEETYVHRRYLPAAERRRLAARLRLGDQQVKTWFQNRRMKEKRTMSAASDSLPPPTHVPNFHVAVYPSPLAGIDTRPQPTSLPQPTLSLAPTSTTDSIPWSSTFPPTDFRQIAPLGMSTNDHSGSSFLLPKLPPTPTVLAPIPLRPRQLYMP